MLWRNLTSFTPPVTDLDKKDQIGMGITFIYSDKFPRRFLMLPYIFRRVFVPLFLSPLFHYAFVWVDFRAGKAELKPEIAELQLIRPKEEAWVYFGQMYICMAN